MKKWFLRKWGFVPSEEDLAKWFEADPGAGLLLAAISRKHWAVKISKQENVMDAWPKSQLNQVQKINKDKKEK